MKTNPNASNAAKGKGKSPEGEDKVMCFLFLDKTGRLHFSDITPSAGMVQIGRSSGATQRRPIPEGLSPERQAASGQLLALQDELVSLIFRAGLEGTASVQGELGRTLLGIRGKITILGSPDTEDQA